ncbi:MAG: D-Ala-D-Ala carboxypeptidase family metallohydrolase [Acidobacteria bacterium]|nr:D-Ala-D-Ala carboxypeptidase family metallohydrolase [Acidobacteriota bacterium]
MNEQLSKHFRRDEFACRCGCGFAAVSPDLVAGLEQLRDQVGKPVMVLSGCRCAAHNAAAGGARNSQHVKGQAVDIRVCGMTARELYTEASAIGGFRGFGLDEERGFLHVDVRSEPTRWCYAGGKTVGWKSEAKNA